MMASLPGAQVTATDLNVAMVDVGLVRVPAATWRQADAMELPFGDASVDLVACQFGVMFFPDRPAAYAEVARVLRPGGQFLFNCWGPLATHDVEVSVMAALAGCFPVDPPSFLARVPHSYHDADRVTADLATAGSGGIQIETVELTCTGGSAADLARVLLWHAVTRRDRGSRRPRGDDPRSRDCTGSRVSGRAGSSEAWPLLLSPPTPHSSVSTAVRSSEQ
jgi:SAM-dependent methyltransferase